MKLAAYKHLLCNPARCRNPMHAALQLEPVPLGMSATLTRGFFSLFQWLGETPRRNVIDHLFKGDKERADKFVKALETDVGLEDPIREVPVDKSAEDIEDEL